MNDALLPKTFASQNVSVERTSDIYQPDGELREYMYNENDMDIEHLVGK